MKEIVCVQTSFCQIIKGVRYAHIILKINITFDFLLDAKNVIIAVNINDVVSVASSGIIISTISAALDQ